MYNFHKTGDVKGSLEIGILPLIKKWLHDNEIWEYTLNKDLSIDIINFPIYIDIISDSKYGILPNYIKFGEVKGNFYAEGLFLRSLRGFPRIIKGNFHIKGNRIKNLKRGPELVYGNYDCWGCRLESLDGIPKEIHGDFDCRENRKKFAEEEVKSRCKVHGKVWV